ncbi:MAG: hypothetical protein FJ265_20245, partial [Planctomycetes bacterium]|nr:hypothetical protein [Planctomycetota bacterium]
MRSRLHPTVLPPLLALAAAVLFAACAGPAPHAPTVPAPAPDCADPVHLPGLHQVVTYAPGFVGGGVPEGEEGLRTLAAMGIKTVVSVDGGAPDAAAAEALGMRYVHLPIRYSGIDRERQLELAQVVANAGGPVYVHCHHGKHRSAGALGSALVMTGVLS